MPPFRLDNGSDSLDSEILRSVGERVENERKEKFSWKNDTKIFIIVDSAVRGWKDFDIKISNIVMKCGDKLLRR